MLKQEMGKIFTALCNSREASMYGPIMGTSLYQVLADTLTLFQSVWRKLCLQYVIVTTKF